jgi:hypothetical protein
MEMFTDFALFPHWESLLLRVTPDSHSFVRKKERRRERCALSSFYHVALSNSTHTTNRTVCYPGSI